MFKKFRNARIVDVSGGGREGWFGAMEDLELFLKPLRVYGKVVVLVDSKRFFRNFSNLLLCSRFLVPFHQNFWSILELSSCQPLIGFWSKVLESNLE